MKYIVLMFSSTILGVLATLAMVAITPSVFVVDLTNSMHQLSFGLLAFAAIIGMIAPLWNIISTEKSLIKDIRQTRELLGLTTDQRETCERDLSECEKALRAYRAGLILKVERMMLTDEAQFERESKLEEEPN